MPTNVTALRARRQLRSVRFADCRKPPPGKAPATHEGLDTPQGFAAMAKKAIVSMALNGMLSPAAATQLIVRLGLADK